jgi:hypothetical protein
MLELTKEEHDSLRSQFGTLKRGEHSKYMPMAFTEQRVAMLSTEKFPLIEFIRGLWYTGKN